MDFGSLLSAYGLPGIIIFALGVVVVYQHRLITSLYDKLLFAQEERRKDGLETAKELNTTLQTFSQSTSMLIDKIRTVRGSE